MIQQQDNHEKAYESTSNMVKEVCLCSNWVKLILGKKKAKDPWRKMPCRNNVK